MMTSQPDILLILVDNQPADMMGCSGNEEIHTPNLDALAARGARFETAYRANAMCPPRRASVLTGLRPDAGATRSRGGFRKLLVACLDALEGWVIDWFRKKGFDVGFAEARELGVNLVSLGNKRVLSMAGSVKLNQAMRQRGYEVFAPDMSMFKPGGGGVHCLCQALKRDSVEV